MLVYHTNGKREITAMHVYAEDPAGDARGRYDLLEWRKDHEVDKVKRTIRAADATATVWVVTLRAKEPTCSA